MPKKPNFADSNIYFGPVVIALMALIVISICCCFWRIDPRAPHDIDIERERERNKAVERVSWGQCDQMAKLFVQYLPTDETANLPKIISKLAL